MFRKLREGARKVLSEPAGEKAFEPDPTAQSNVERSLTFRRDYYKYALGIATALLAFSVSFQPTLSQAPIHAWLLIPGWGGLGLAILIGLRLHMLWAKFLITFSDHRSDRARGDEVRKSITASRRLHDKALIVTLAAGVTGIAAFAGFNLPYIAPKAGAVASGPAQPAPAPSDDDGTIAEPSATTRTGG